jgi:hypothetical protein
MACLPGMPCYGQLTRIVYPKGCDPCLYVKTDAERVVYTGPNLSCTGIQNGDCLETALEKIDGRICSEELVSHILEVIANNPVLQAYLCNLISTCPAPSPSTSTTSTTFNPLNPTTTSSTTTSVPGSPTTTTTTTSIPESCYNYTVINYTGDTLELEYLNCEGQLIVVPLIAFDNQLVCAQVNTVFVVGNPGSYDILLGDTCDVTNTTTTTNNPPTTTITPGQTTTTTSTTFVPGECQAWINDTAMSVMSPNYTDCLGNLALGIDVAPGDTICIQAGSWQSAPIGLSYNGICL